MARGNQTKPVAKAWYDAMSGVPNWPTTMRSNLGDGRLIGVNPNSRDGIGSVWLYKKLPLSPMVDARDDAEMERSVAPLTAAFEALSRASGSVGGRRLAEASYREFHLLEVNVPRRFRPPAGHPLHDILLESFGDKTVERRLALFGVRLVPAVDMSGGFGTAVRGFMESLTSAGVPLVEFNKDFARLDAELSRAGLVTPSDADVRLANCWWNLGKYADTPMMAHHNHTHLFGTVEAAVRATQSAPESCEEWDADTVPDEWAVTMASATDFEVDGLTSGDGQARWVSMLLNMGALAISMRGKIEPAKVTRGVIRKNKELYERDIMERAAAGKSSRGEQETRLARLSAVEDHYANGTAPPTIKGLSTIIGFDGNIPDLRDITPAELPLVLSPMSDLQPVAMAETYLCSPARGNPTLHDLPSHVVSYSGISSLSVVGDPPKNSILLGLTETDRQPAWMNMSAASNDDQVPAMVIPAGTGSGKLVKLSTIIPTPSGRTTMGELKVGDQVLGRDGKSCTVTYLSPVDETPDLYRITLSDGQQILADANHQWVVSDFTRRNRQRDSDHVAALAFRDRLRATAATLEQMSLGFGPDHESTAPELWDLISGLDHTWNGTDGIDAALRMTDCPRMDRRRTLECRSNTESITKIDPVLVWPSARTLESLLDGWRNCGASNRARWGAKIDAKAAAANKVLTDLSDTDEHTMPELVRLLVSAGSPTMQTAEPSKVARKAGIEPRETRRAVTAPRKAAYHRPVQVSAFPTAVALKSLALRLVQRHEGMHGLEAREEVLSTLEMVDRGVRVRGEQANFSIRTTAPLNLPEADLPVDPYVFGIWAGDGSASDGVVTSEDLEIVAAVEAAGFPCVSIATRRDYGFFRFKGLHQALRETGLRRLPSRHGHKLDKRIPNPYLRGSYEQRLALLQGLMDTDGTIDSGGACELTLCKRDLADDALELIRSLGIKVSMREAEAGYTLPDPDNPRVKVRTSTGTRYRMVFTTDLSVFKLPRKADRLPNPGTLRETQKWLYVTSIAQVTPDDPDYGPGRCIQVDSSDSTYLCAGMVPTHNTMFAQWAAYQTSRIPNALGEKTPVVLFNPKPGQSLQTLVDAVGGSSFRLDELTAADGAVDPLRFSRSPQDGMDLAVSVLMSINPWAADRDSYEVPLFKALKYGVDRGATATGQALHIARAELNDAVITHMVNMVDTILDSVPQVRALIGVNPKGDGLRVSQGLTLIEVGNSHLNLPEPGTPNPDLTQRTALALVRMMVFGTMSALTGRQGVVFLDEGWVFTSAGKTEMDRLGRLARSLEVFPILLTQKVTDALEAGMAGYISRGLIMSIPDMAEARASFELFKLDATPQRLGRVTAKSKLGGDTDTVGDGAETGAAFDWSSLKALIDSDRRVHRGSVGYHVDLAGRCVPVEIAVPDWFIRIASTNGLDIRAREEAARMAALAEGGMLVGAGAR